MRTFKIYCLGRTIPITPVTPVKWNILYLGRFYYKTKLYPILFV